MGKLGSFAAKTVKVALNDNRDVFAFNEEGGLTTTQTGLFRVLLEDLPFKQCTSIAKSNISPISPINHGLKGIYSILTFVSIVFNL